MSRVLLALEWPGRFYSSIKGILFASSKEAAVFLRSQKPIFFSSVKIKCSQANGRCEEKANAPESACEIQKGEACKNYKVQSPRGSKGQCSAKHLVAGIGRKEHRNREENGEGVIPSP